MSFGGRCGATLRWCGYCIRLVAQREPLDHYGWCWKRGAERWDSRCALFFVRLWHTINAKPSIFLSPSYRFDGWMNVKMQMFVWLKIFKYKYINK